MSTPPTSGRSPDDEPPQPGDRSPYDQTHPYGVQPFGGPQPYGAQPQPYDQQSPYGYPPPGYPPQAYHLPGTNGMAIASLVLGILWIYWIGSILALVFGYVAKRQIRRTGERGSGMATAGIVLGWIGVAVLVLGVVGLGIAASSG